MFLSRVVFPASLGAITTMLVLVQTTTTDALQTTHVGIPKLRYLPPLSEPWNLTIDNYHHFAHSYRQPHMDYDQTLAFIQEFTLDEWKDVSHETLSYRNAAADLLSIRACKSREIPM